MGATIPLPPGLPDFPAADRHVDTPASLRERGLWLRHATSADLVWLHRLYATTRAEEMAQVPWPDTLKQAFLADQFGLQHRHYLSHYDNCDFLVIEGTQGPLGRYYLQRGPQHHLVVDISLWPQSRNQGIGRALIEASQQEAWRERCELRLHVLTTNHAAKRLYQRLGFVVVETQGIHHRMQWNPVYGASNSPKLCRQEGGAGG
ncbi:GNAT family N-acetyltransferase [Lysobacter terrae]